MCAWRVRSLSRVPCSRPSGTPRPQSSFSTGRVCLRPAGWSRKRRCGAKLPFSPRRGTSRRAAMLTRQYSTRFAALALRGRLLSRSCRCNRAIRPRRRPRQLPASIARGCAVGAGGAPRLPPRAGKVRDRRRPIRRRRGCGVRGARGRWRGQSRKPCAPASTLRPAECSLRHMTRPWPICRRSPPRSLICPTPVC